ncbi:MAG: HAMP domain-containing histidine kinase [Anaerolineae bacterium]|nr:HAMP domain-containing histidine kinase [Anaerolineae bacterium]NUQ03351.1 HAMP domain-containing histidine kinase [Anaerolineae bacterium]
MFQRLRARLFLSYLLVLFVTLAVISFALLFIFNTRAAPTEPTLQRLATVAVSVNLREVIVQSGFDLIRPTQEDFNRLSQTLSQVAAARGVRLLLVNMNERTVRYDSAAGFALGASFVSEMSSYRFPAALTRYLFTNIDAITGNFTDPQDGQQWVFVGVEGLREQAIFSADTFALVFADLRPQQTLQDALTEFGAELFPLLAQGALVGVVIAVVVAGFIARSIAQPLQTVATAASEVAQGRFAQHVPVKGPREVQAVAEAFNQMSANVQSAQQAQKDFLANVSHDLKTPLTSIQGYSQAIIDGAALDPVKAAKIIHDEAERLNRMVVELTDLARIQAGRLSMKWTAIDLGQLTDGVAQRLAVVAREKKVTLSVNCPPMPEVAGDGDRLVQVVTNLIGNAIKYTPAGGHVWVGTRVEKSGVLLTIKDDGQGIPATELSRIFERFYQVDKARGPQRGTGLGLAIVQEIVTAHGGTLSAYSDGENAGSTFTVWLPSPQMTTIIRRRS